MKKITLSTLLSCFFYAVVGQASLHNAGNMQIHSGGSVSVYGNFEQNGSLVVGSGAFLGNQGIFTYAGSISGTGVFFYGDTATLVYAGPSQQNTGFELPITDGPLNVVVENSNGLILSDNTSVTNLVLSNGDLLVGNHTLTLNGAFTGSGNNALRLNGLSSIITNGTTGILYFDQTSLSSHTAYNFSITSGTATLGNPLAITGIVTHTAGTLTSGGNLSLLVTDSLTYGQVAGTGTGTISGEMSMQMIIPGTLSGWRSFCSPLNNTTLDDLGTQTEVNLTNTAPSGDNRNVYTWTEATKTWGLVTANENMYGKAYNIFFFDPSNTTIELSGDYNKGDMNFGQLSFVNSSTADEDGWHLVANPYPSGLNWNSISRPAEMNNQYAIWSTRDGNYHPWNGTVGLAGQYIAPMHAFWVKVTANTTTDFVVSSANRVTNTNNQFGKKDAFINVVTLDVRAVTGSYKDQLIIYFNESKMPDAEEGAVKLMGNTAAPQLWSVKAGKKYSIDVYGPEVSDDLVIPVGFKTSISGTYTFEPTLANMALGMEVWLEDSKTQQWHKLSDGPYTFDYQSSEILPNRFYLHYKHSVTGIEADETVGEKITAYTSDGAIKVKISGNENNGPVTIVVWNMLGQSVCRQSSVEGNEFTLYPNTNVPGMYLVDVRTKKGVHTLRILR